MSIDALREVWSDVQKLLDLKSLVQLSKSCRFFRELVTDRDTGTIKVNQVQVDFEGNPLLADCILRSVHFPSLLSLNLKQENDDSSNRNCDESHIELFRFLSYAFASATKLEELVLDFTLLIEVENDLQMLFGVFGKSLSNCKQLKRLQVFNQRCGVGCIHYLRHSVALMSALAVAIQEGARDLEEIILQVGGIPSLPDYPTASNDFFSAVLELINLKCIDFQIDFMWNGIVHGLLEACTKSRTQGFLPFQSLEKCTVGVSGTRLINLETGEELQSLYAGPHIVSFLSLLIEAPCLKKFDVRLSRNFWDNDSIVELGTVLNRNPTLNTCFIGFGGYEDETGMIAEFILRFIGGRESRLDNNICFYGFEGENDALDELGDYIHYGGAPCLQAVQNGYIFKAWGYVTKL